MMKRAKVNERRMEAVSEKEPLRFYVLRAVVLSQGAGRRVPFDGAFEEPY